MKKLFKNDAFQFLSLSAVIGLVIYAVNAIQGDDRCQNGLSHLL